MAAEAETPSTFDGTSSANDDAFPLAGSGAWEISRSKSSNDIEDICDDEVSPKELVESASSMEGGGGARLDSRRVSLGFRSSEKVANVE